ncbi:glycosyl transferase group 1 [Actinobacteria bacterium OK074]|nr:glycosyl transferase group 1 [Actinobacteria bacterium OK074]
MNRTSRNRPAGQENPREQGSPEGRPPRPRRLRIVFLLHNAYAIGGTVRTTLNLAGALAGRHDVTIVSMARHRDVPRFEIDPRITLVSLVDTRDGSADLADPLYARPAADFPARDKRSGKYTRLSDVRARAYLKRCRADVIIGTRPGINVYLARFGPRRALRIAQEHLYLDAHHKKLRPVLARHYRALDAVVTMTEADAAVYRARMHLPGVRVEAVPNIVPPTGLPPADATAKVIAAAGRLAPGKRFDLLLAAYAIVAGKEPEWELRIYGGGGQKERLQELIGELGLTGRARLMGTRTPIEAEFARASVVASASDTESFGMTLVEAMRCAVPVVSTDCPLGPAEIITDGVDGRLVPTGDPDALATALLDLIADEDLRRAMGTAARASAHRYDPEPIVARYERLFADLRTTRARRTWQRESVRVRAGVRRRLRPVLARWREWRTRT